MPKVIDIHSHYVSPDLIGEAERNGASYGVSVEQGSTGAKQLQFCAGARLRPFFPELCDLELRIPGLEASGVERQVLSTWTDMAGDVLEGREAAGWARLQNETLADAANRYPARFIAMGTLPLQDVAAACAELDHLVRRLGVRSIELSTNINGRDLDGPEFRPLWKRIRDYDVFVLLHPGFVTIAPDRLGSYFLNNLIGFPTDTTIAAARLVFSGLMEEIPGLKLCLAHAGGFLPYQIGRMDRGFSAHPACRASVSTAPSATLGKFFFDTITHGDGALKFLFDTVDADRILYGSDYPFEMLDPAGPSRIENLHGLTARQKSAALFETAETVLGLVSNETACAS
jgi:aminocarboxymuconate-semialdehyde decarboxylase